MGELVDVQQHDAIVEIALNRPESYNAFNFEMVSQLAHHLTTTAGDNDVRAVVISGRGKAFCAGGRFEVGP